jgi:hypothetical protein
VGTGVPVGRRVRLGRGVTVGKRVVVVGNALGTGVVEGTILCLGPSEGIRLGLSEGEPSSMIGAIDGIIDGVSLMSILLGARDGGSLLEGGAGGSKLSARISSRNAKYSAPSVVLDFKNLIKTS